MENLSDVVKGCNSYREVLYKLNKSVTGSSVSFLKKKLEKMEISTEHFYYTKKKSYSSNKLSWESILVNGRNTYRESGKRLTIALLESGVEYKCNKCNLDSWLNLKITLEVNHIDGNFLNNEKENLEFLCPNCHSLTSNFYNKSKSKPVKFCNCGNLIKTKAKKCTTCSYTVNGFNKRKVARPSKEILEKLVWELPTTKIAEKYGVSDVAVSKWCKSYGIPKPSRGYWGFK